MAVKRGDLARETVRNKIIEAFGVDYVGTVDKKIYVQAKDGENGETLQFAIAMTMPKTPINAAAGTSTGETNVTMTVTELSESDVAKVAALKKMLGVE